VFYTGSSAVAGAGVRAMSSDLRLLVLEVFEVING